jgi:dihydrofolate synthase/folylpolyglutamate synthase
MLTDWLFSFPGRGVKTFAAMQRLDAKLNFPHRSFRSVHIGGTNGKGSVAWKVAESLRLEGYRVGLYTSPHIRQFHERIRVDGEMISESDAERALEQIHPHVVEELSFFDLLTAMAFLYFQERCVDWAVVEVGLGGRLDATNVICPEAAAIVSIGYDHQQILGSTLEEIAFEKGGIAKPGVPLVAGPSAAPFFPHAEAVDRAPFYDLENRNVASALLKKLGVKAPKGLHVRPPCRFEVRGRTIFDVAHNPDGFERLAEALRFHYPEEKFCFAVAFTKEKNWRGCIDSIAPLASRIVALRGHHPKLIPPERLAEEDARTELADCLRSTKERTVFCGSFYCMDEALQEK